MGGQMTGQEVLVDDGAAIALHGEVIGKEIGPIAEKYSLVARPRVLRDGDSSSRASDSMYASRRSGSGEPQGREDQERRS
jgi:hypothetical protein